MQIVKERLDLDLSDYAELETELKRYGDELAVPATDDEKVERLVIALDDVLNPILKQVKDKYLHVLLDNDAQRVRGTHWVMFIKPVTGSKYKTSENTPKEFRLNVTKTIPYDEAIEQYKMEHGTLPEGVKELKKQPTIALKRNQEE